jgi:hypothetical protein
MRRACSECGAPLYAKGLCRLHYDRAKAGSSAKKPKQLHDGSPRRRTQVWLSEPLFHDLVMETVQHEGRKVAETVRLAVAEYLEKRRRDVSPTGDNTQQGGTT